MEMQLDVRADARAPPLRFPRKIAGELAYVCLVSLGGLDSPLQVKLETRAFHKWCSHLAQIPTHL